MNVRFAAAEALGQLGSKNAIAALRKMSRAPGADAVDAPSGEAEGRMYASYVATSLSKGTKPLRMRQWRLETRRKLTS
jgi:hypothetical protein